MKRIISILLVTALLIGMIPVMVTAAADTTSTQYAVITSANGKKVRMREGPSKVYDPIDSYPVGTTVIVLQNGTEWSQIRIGDVTGWMMSEFLIFGAGGSGSGSSSGTANATVISNNGLRVWLRATAGGKRLFLNAAGTPVTVLEYDDDWCRVSINGVVGYMMTKYISETKKEEHKEETSKGGRITGVTLNYQYPTVLDTLSVTTEPENATVKYSWQVYGESGKNSWVERGTEATFEVLTRYANCKIRCVVTGVSPYTGSATATSAMVQISRSLSSVSLNNTRPVVGDTLKAILQPSSAMVEYSWRVGGVEVSDAEEYLVQESDVGKSIQLKVSGIGGYSGSTACSTDEVVASDKAVQSVTISDSTPSVGQTLSATVHPSAASVNYVWSADGATVGTGATYQVTNREMGKKITLTVTGKSPYTGTATDSTKNVTQADLASVSLTTSSPMVGDTIYATVNPSGASAKYIWHIYETGSDEDPVIATGASSSLKLADVMNGYEVIGKQIFVVAEGTGIYNGIVNSGRTGEIKSGKKITGASLNAASPVIKDVLTVKLTPDYLNDSENAALKESFTYVWEIGSEKRTDYGSSYEVTAADKGKQIRVRVVGTNEYSGDVYSGYTNAVKEEGTLTGAKIKNLTTSTDATNVAPEVGQTLEACAVPEPADTTDTVVYEWYRGRNRVSTSKTYTVTYEDYKEGSLKVVITPKKASNYDEEKDVSARTAGIVSKKQLKIALTIEAPEAGKKPVTSLKKEDLYSASITWIDPVTKSIASMDQYGNFKPNTKYTAKITIKPDSDYTLYNALVQVNGGSAVQDEPSSKIFYYSFPATGVQQIDNFYIADLDAPVVSDSNYKYDMVCNNDQLYGKVETPWDFDGKFTHTATITLYAKPGYTLDGLPANVFKVNGATSCTYAAGGNTLIVTYEMEPELYITSNKTEVYQDGLNRQIVHLTANLRNWSLLSTADVQWKVLNPTTDATLIYQDGQLIVGADEQTGRSLIVEASLDLHSAKYDKPLVATLEIPIVSGTATDTALNVVFTKSPTNLVAGRSYTFAAYVENSLIGCELFLLDSNGNAQHLGTNEYTWNLAGKADDPSDDVKPGTYIIKAISNENHAVSATLAVTVHRSITIKDVSSTINYGEFLLVKTVETDSDFTVYVNGKELDGKIIDTTDYAVGDTLTIKVVSKADSSATDTASTLIVDAAPSALPTLLMAPLASMPAVVTDETALPDEAVATDEAAVTDEIPVVDAAPVTDATPATDETPVADATPVTDETPVVDAAPVTDETLVVDAAPVTDETPVADAAPVTDETPVVDAAPVTDETPVVDAAPVTDETPVADAAPVTDETPATDATTTEGGASITITNADGSTSDIIIIEEADDEEDEKQSNPVVEEPKDDTASAESKQPESKATKKKQAAAAEDDEETLLTEEELAELEAETEGESNVEAAIKVSITKKAAQVGRGRYSVYEASVTGSEKGVRWSLYHSVDGASSIDQNGKLTVGVDEKAETLTIVATSREDGSIRAYCKVEVVEPEKTTVTTAATSAPAATDTVAPVPTDTTTSNPSTPATESKEPVAEESEKAPSAAEMEEIWKTLMEEEKKQLENANSIYNLF